MRGYARAGGVGVKLKRITVEIIVTEHTTILPVIATLGEAIYRIGREYEANHVPWAPFRRESQTIQLGLMDDPGNVSMPQRSTMTIEEVQPTHSQAGSPTPTAPPVTQGEATNPEHL